ncbi:MAG: PrsW family glutamic-type intramembrane protease, partial [Planctomycetota bacterium]|nr:PrsW family glutamic-type intramembrane protease [Planctomycetota bacterium]
VGAAATSSRSARGTMAAVAQPPMALPPIPTAPAYRSQLPLQQTGSGGEGATRRFAYLLLLAALFPLIWSTLREDNFDFEDALSRTVEKHPETGPKIGQLMESEDATMDDLFNALPDHRLDGSHLSHDTYVHWLYALLSSAAFSALILAIFPRSIKRLGWMLLVGLFTATIGIFLLLGFQWVADWTQNFWVTGRSILVLLFYIVKFIGYSYRAALDPESNFFLSTVGFTLGVGLCEELVKAVPVLFHYQTTQDNRWPWRTACMVGFLSGIGFGVSEGIHYSSNMYNGVTGGDIYLVRFVSCVALHAVWSGSAAVFIFRHQGQLQGSDNVFSGALTWVAMVAVPMVLHGLYDTLLKKDMSLWALVTALASFAWLIYQIEGARRDYPDDEAVTA